MDYVATEFYSQPVERCAIMELPAAQEHFHLQLTAESLYAILPEPI
jgi:hypothetical protein